MDFGDVIWRVVQAMSPLFMGAITWASVKLSGLIKAKVNHSYWQGLLLRLDDAVMTTVKELQQTLVQGLKAASSDGKITSAEKARVKQQAVDRIRAILGPKLIKELEMVLGLGADAVSQYIGAKVEAAVLDLHRA